MKISMVAAVSENGVIGRGGKIPWSLPIDLARFRVLTFNHHILMGRATYESIGRPLPGRVNLVLSRRLDYLASGCLVVPSFDDAIRLAQFGHESELMIIGGARVYEQGLLFARQIYLTRVHAEFEGDTCFPYLDPDRWKLTCSERYSADSAHSWPFSFCQYDARY